MTPCSFQTSEVSLCMSDLTNSLAQLTWQLPEPFVSVWTIEPTHIDHYNHTNNVAYLSQVENLAWAHSKSLGLAFTDYQTLDRAMVIVQHNLSYHAPSHLADNLACATWIVACDKKFRLSRRFEFINLRTNKTVFSAKTDFVCVSLKDGVPKRMPEKFSQIYGDALIVVS
jgi:acyl-CoA thioester hydrolase